MAGNKTPLWKIEGDKVVRTHKTCPKCGPGVYMAIHYDRMHCGRCSYTIWKKKNTKGPAGDAASGPTTRRKKGGSKKRK